MSKPIVAVITDTHLNGKNTLLVIDIFMQFIDLMKQYEIKIAVFCGDAFQDRSSQQFENLIAMKMILNLFADNNITLYAIHGNHDKTDQDADDSYLDIYEHTPGLKLFPSFGFVDLPDNKITLSFLSYFTEGVEYTSRLNELKKLLKPSRNNVLFTHIAVNGVKNNDGSIVEKGIDLKEFNFFKRVYIGHYHNSSQINDAVFYFGSAYQANYGEDINKGFMILHDDLGVEIFQSNFKRFIKLKIPASEVITARKELSSYDTSKDNVRITFTGGEDELQSIDVNSFRKLGVEVKCENTKELSIDFEDIDQVDLNEISQKQLKKFFVEYMNKKQFSSKQKVQALKYFL